MLSPEIIIQDIDARGWANLLSLVDRRTIYGILGEEREGKSPPKRLFIIYQGIETLKAWHSEKGSLLDNFQWTGPKRLEDVACEEGVDRVTAIERGAIGRIFARFQAEIDIKDDYVKQIFAIVDAVRAEMGNGLHFYPEPKLPNIGYDTAQQIFKILTHDNSTIVLYVFDGNEVWTSTITGVKDGHVDLFTTHDALAADGFSIADWRRDYHRINDAIAAKFRRPSLSVFIDLKSLARIMKTKKPLRALDKAQKAKDVIIDPIPALIKTALGAGKLIGK